MVIITENKKLMRKLDYKMGTVKVGDRIVYDGNPKGVTPKLGKGTVLAIGSGLAGHGNPKPARILKIKGDSGNTFSIDETAVEGILR